MPPDKTPDKTAGQKPASTNDAGPKTPDVNPPGASSDATADTSKTDTDLLSAAAASGDADVQNLLAQREIAQRNGDEDAVKDIDDRLRAGLEK